MRIKNLTKRKIIARNSIFLDDNFSKFIGLMFSKSTKIGNFRDAENPKDFQAKQGRALIFKFNKEKAIHLHMLFVFYPIDVLFLDKNKAVIDKKENFKPFTFYKSRKKAMYAIELPNGIIRKTKTGMGDEIEF